MRGGMEFLLVQLQLQAVGVEFLHPDKFTAEALHPADPDFRIGDIAQCLDGVREFSDDQAFDVTKAVFGFHAQAFPGELEGLRLSLSFVQPILISAATPFREVIFGNGMAGELFG